MRVKEETGGWLYPPTLKNQQPRSHIRGPIIEGQIQGTKEIVQVLFT